ncbi:hypothetical protein ACGFSA_34910, partial [Streptomyces sp. NPDC048496]
RHHTPPASPTKALTEADTAKSINGYENLVRAQIQVHNLVYPLADYKLEVAVVCMTGWLREQLDAPDPGIVVRADPERGAFVIEWGDLVGDPFTE